MMNTTKTAAYTPWGPAQQITEIADGITSYSTASHGGYKLSRERLGQMPEAFRDIKPWAGIGWYEEDADWSLVALSFPEYFDRAAISAAVWTVETLSYARDAAKAFFQTDRGRRALQKGGIRP